MPADFAMYRLFNLLPGCVGPVTSETEEMRPRVSSMDPQSSIQSARIKRYPFQPNPVSGNTVPAGNWKTMSLDRSEPVTSYIQPVGQPSSQEAAPISQPATAKANGEHPSPALAEPQRSNKEAELNSNNESVASGSQVSATESVALLEDSRQEEVSRHTSVGSESSNSSISRSSSIVSQTQKEAETK